MQTYVPGRWSAQRSGRATTPSAVKPGYQTDLALPAEGSAPDDETQAWPKELASQIARVGWQPSDGVKALAKHFVGVRAPTIQRHVGALVALGQV